MLYEVTKDSISKFYVRSTLQHRNRVIKNELIVLRNEIERGIFKCDNSIEIPQNVKNKLLNRSLKRGKTIWQN